MDSKYGIPIVTAKNVFDVARELGVTPWPELEKPMPLEEYAGRDLSEADRSELRFVIKTEVARFADKTGKPYTGFRQLQTSWSTVFAMLSDDLVPVTLEWKTGNEQLCIIPPTGTVSKKDREAPDPMKAAGAREWLEETGIPLASITRIGSPRGVPLSGRNNIARVHYFMGTVDEPFVRGPSKLDANEYLKLVLINVADLLDFLDEGEYGELTTVGSVYHALRALGRLTLRPSPEAR